MRKLSMTTLLCLTFFGVMLGLVFTQQIEHNYHTRGIMCELGYIQGKVDAAKNLDYLIKEVKSEESKHLFRKIKEYIQFSDNVDRWGKSDCVHIKVTSLESALMPAWFRLKRYLGFENPDWLERLRKAANSKKGEDEESN